MSYSERKAEVVVDGQVLDYHAAKLLRRIVRAEFCHLKKRAADVERLLVLLDKGSMMSAESPVDEDPWMAEADRRLAVVKES